MVKTGKLLAGCIVVLVCVLAISVHRATAKQSAQPGKAEVSLRKIRKMRKKAAHRKRRIVFHSDGRSMNSEKMVFPHTVGTQVDAYTYSLVHQFNLARFYRSKVAQEVTQGEDRNNLDKYIEFCRKNNADAIWAMRMNDTHDVTDTPVYRKRLKMNKFKQEHPEFLVGSIDNRSPHGRWTSVDYTHDEVRERVFRIWEEVCQNYAVDGLLFDFFRHLTYFKSTAWGGTASKAEIKKMTALLRRTRKMADEIGAKRGRPILLIVRTPDSFGYCKALGLDVEQWMKEGLIDIWLPTGYFRLQEWEETVRQAHKYDTPVWASFDESRISPSRARNNASVYRARAMNAWRAGIDSIDLFNFGYLPPDPHMQLLNQLGDIETLKYTDKTYFADTRGASTMPAQYWLRGGDRFITRPMVFTPDNPLTLMWWHGEPTEVNLLIGDDISSVQADGFKAAVTLTIITDGLKRSDAIDVKLNGQLLKNSVFTGDTPSHDDKDQKGYRGPRSPKQDYAKGQKLDYNLPNPELLKLGNNLVEIGLHYKTGYKAIKLELRDIYLTIKYEPVKK